MTYGHGDDIYHYGEQVKINFSSNIYSHADLSELKNHLADRLDVIAHYPEPAPRELEAMIARQHGIPADMVMVTNGANEAIYLIAQLYRGWTSIIPQPTYIEYADACDIFDHIVTHENAVQTVQAEEDRIYWLCNPNNPTGNVMTKTLLAYIVRRNPRYLFVIDQSYADYTNKEMLQQSEMTDCYNLMLIHSLSKKYCIPGIRLGYVTASPIIISRLKEIRQPWAVNALAIEAGKYLIGNNVRVLPELDPLLAEAQRLKDNLSQIEGIMVMDTNTNFMLAHIDWADSGELKKWLIENHGILIRDASNFYSLDKHYVRIAAQTPEENDLLVEAIREYKDLKII